MIKEQTKEIYSIVRNLNFVLLNRVHKNANTILRDIIENKFTEEEKDYFEHNLTNLKLYHGLAILSKDFKFYPLLIKLPSLVNEVVYS